MVLGGGSNTLTLTSADAACLISRLPGGGPSAKLNGNATCAVPTGILLKTNGRFNNGLLAQAITLGLNLRLDPSLAGVQLTGTTLSTQATTNCGANAAGGPVLVQSMHQSVINYLGTSNTVADLFNLANQALEGTYVYATGRPHLNHIASAMSAINNAYDECRINAANDPTARTTEPSAGEEEEEEGMLKADASIVLNAYPNPFTSSTTIEFVVPQAEQDVTLDIYDLKGAHVQRMFRGNVEAGLPYTFKLNGDQLQQGFYLGRLVTGDKVEHLRMLLQK